MIEIKIWWADPKVNPTTYPYADRAIAEQHWEGFKNQESVDHARMYDSGHYIKSFTSARKL